MGALLPALGVLCAGLSAAVGLSWAARLPAWWAALAVVPLGVTGYSLLILPCVRLAGAGAGTALASAVAAIGLGLVAWRLRAGPRWSGCAGAGHKLGRWGMTLGLMVAASVIGLAGGRFALAAIQAAPAPALLGDPSTGDWGLHVLRAAMIARYGLPAPSPLDPDYQLQYRYLFHALAAALSSTSGADLPTSCAAVTGVVLGCVVVAGGSLAYLIRASQPLMVSAALVAALYGPTYWLPEAIGLLSRGQVPTPAALAALMPEPWPISPLAPAFPSMLTAQGSSPTLPLAVLSWFATLICGGCASRMLRPRARLWAAGAAGACLASLAFSADFFVPVAVAALAAGALLAGRSADRRLALAGGVAFAVTLLLLIVSAGQFGAAGAARNIHVGFSSALTTTPVYGGNHALLGGGTPVPLPNWVHFHDWGIAFWPALAATLYGALRLRRPLFFCAGVAALGSAAVWHLLEVTYTTGTSTDTRVQMYRYASLATALAAPLLPLGVGEVTRALSEWIRQGFQLLLFVVCAGAGLLWVLVAAPLSTQPPEEWAGDIALARRLANEPTPRRLVVLNGPTTFLTMYNAGPGGNLPLWWAFGETPVPVGWDFGYPERYEPLYRRVAVDLDPRAAAELGVTHVAVASAAFPDERRDALMRFLAECGAAPVAVYGAPTDPEGRELYRLGSSTCTPSGAPA